MLRRSLVVSIAGFLAACATSTIDPQTKASIASVYLEPVQVSKAAVFAPSAHEASASSGRVPATVSEATSRLQQVLDARASLPRLIESQAKQDLVAKGYRVTDASSGATAKLKIIVNHALSVPVGANDGRGVAMTVNAEMVRASDGRRLLFTVANQVKDPTTKGVRLVPYAEWFANDDFVVTTKVAVVSGGYSLLVGAATTGCRARYSSMPAVAAYRSTPTS